MLFVRRALRLACALACAAAPILAAAPTASAKAELTVSPTILQLDAEAGELLTQPITVAAGEDEPITVELVHADFGFDDSNYQVTLIRDDAPETTSFSTRDWFSLPKQQYRIPAGRSLQLPLAIHVPENTPGGTYLGAALIRVVPSDAKPGASQVQAVPETGPLLFIAVEGGDPPKPAIRKFDVPGWVKGGPIRPDIVVENRGDEFFTYEGTVELHGPGADSKVEVTRQFVVPGQPRRVATSANDKGRAGHPVLARTQDLKFGRYEVVTRLRIEPTGTTLVSRRTVWVIPTWVWMAGILLALVFAASAALVARWVIERRRLAPFVAEAEAELAREQAASRPRDASVVDDTDDGLEVEEPSFDEDVDEPADEFDEDDESSVDLLAEELDDEDEFDAFEDAIEDDDEDDLSR
jgi:hypothetical protein